MQFPLAKPFCAPKPDFHNLLGYWFFWPGCQRKRRFLWLNACYEALLLGFQAHPGSATPQIMPLRNSQERRRDHRLILQAAPIR